MLVQCRSNEYTTCPLLLGEEWRGRVEEEIAIHLLPSADFPWKLPDAPIFLKLPESAAPCFPKGSVKPQTSLYHHFLLELRTKTGNISVISQFTARYWVAGQEDINLLPMVPGACRGPLVMGLPEETSFLYLRYREVFPKSRADYQATWVSTHTFNHNCQSAKNLQTKSWTKSKP